MSIRIHKPGMLTTIQDLGRYGHQHLGISVCGAMDADSLRLANHAVGNNENEAALEVTLIGPRIEFLDDVAFCVTGANLNASLDGRLIRLGIANEAKAGTVLSFGSRVNGCRSYVAFAGGMDVPVVLGSRSTDLRVGFGGWHGRALRADDVIPLRKESVAAVDAQRMHRDAPLGEVTVRAMRGPHFDVLAPHSADLLFSATSFRIGSQSNRMGYRLEGNSLESAVRSEILSEPVQFGTVQLPPDGNPIILMADRQTTGGYPRILEVAAIDLPLLAQVIPGSDIRFSEITIDDAQTLYRHQL